MSQLLLTFINVISINIASLILHSSADWPFPDMIVFQSCIITENLIAFDCCSFICSRYSTANESRLRTEIRILRPLNSIEHSIANISILIVSYLYTWYDIYKTSYLWFENQNIRPQICSVILPLVTVVKVRNNNELSRLYQNCYKVHK